jgi:inner membrane protein
MNIITHLLVGWTLAEHTTKSPRDRALITVAGVVPDLDGLGLMVDAAAPLFNWTVQWYERFHHQLLHGIPAALLITALLACLARERWRAACLIFVSFHLHLLGDLLGSRGSGVTDIWPIHYLAPLSNQLTFAWSGQWPLSGRQNTSITVVLLAYMFVLAVQRGYSPVSLVSARADKAFVETLRRRWRSLKR